MMSDVPVFYDREATCIGGLPIEIGWAFIDTATGEIQSESHLVKPPLHWDMQPVWDPDAEELHGISLEQLLAQGRPPFKVARRMNEVLTGKLLSDAPADDERWLRFFSTKTAQNTFTNTEDLRSHAHRAACNEARVGQR